MTKFSFEVPIKHLQDFDDLQDYLFTLSILYKNSEYCKYIHQKANEGLTAIWLDNSFNETFEADKVYKLINLYQQYPFNRVVSPDDICWYKETINESFQRLAAQIGSSKALVVVSDMEMFEYMKQQGARNFAVSYRARASLSYDELKQIPRLHFLGLLNPEELLKVKPLSCDTSMPIKIAIQGLRLSDWIQQGCPHINTKDLGHQGRKFFDLEMDPFTIDLARRNIWELKELIKKKI